jgi:hypothetical protein
MNRFVELPSDRLGQMRSELLSELNQPDSDAAKEAYARLVASISNPVSSRLVRAVRGSKRLQVCLNAIILWRRASWALYAGILILGILGNWWLLLLIPLAWVVNDVALNHVQTLLNVELAARLFLLHVLMDEDPAFRERVFAVVGGEAMPQKPQA